MKQLTVLFFMIMFVIATDMFLISPLIPTLQELFHVSTERAGWMMGAYALGYASFALIAGPLSDGWDRKKVMLTGIVCFSAATMLCGLATGFWSMFAFRFAAGVSSAFTAPQVWAAVPALFPPAKSAKALGILFAGLAIAQTLGVPLGSLLAVTHWSYPFFTIGALSLMLAFWIYFAMPSMKPNAAGARSSVLARYVPLLTSGKARGALLAYFLFQLGNYAAYSFIGKWLSDRFQVSVEYTGYVMIGLGIGQLAGSLCSSYVLHKLSRWGTMLLGVLFLAAAFILLPALPSLTAVTAVYFLISAVLFILFPLMMGLLTGLNPALRGTISSLTNSAMYAAITIGSWLAGLLYAWFNGFAAVGIFTAVCFAASLLTFVFSGALTVEAKGGRELAS